MISISVIEDEKWMWDIIVEYLNVARTKFQEVKYQTYESAEAWGSLVFSYSVITCCKRRKIAVFGEWKISYCIVFYHSFL